MNILKYGLFLLFMFGCGQNSSPVGRVSGVAANPNVPQSRPAGRGILEANASAMVSRLEFQASIIGGGSIPCNVPLDASGFCPSGAQNQNLLYYNGRAQLRGSITFGQRYTSTCPQVGIECLPVNIPLPFVCEAQFQGSGFRCQSLTIQGRSYQARGELLASQNLTHNYRVIYFAVCRGPGVPEVC